MAMLLTGRSRMARLRTAGESQLRQTSLWLGSLPPRCVVPSRSSRSARLFARALARQRTCYARVPTRCRQVFPVRHPAIDFLLLLAVADDAIGLVIIAAVYYDPNHPVEPLWMLLLLAAVTIAWALRKLAGFQHWIWCVCAASARVPPPAVPPVSLPPARPPRVPACATASTSRHFLACRLLTAPLPAPSPLALSTLTRRHPRLCRSPQVRAACWCPSLVWPHPRSAPPSPRPLLRRAAPTVEAAARPSQSATNHTSLRTVRPALAE